MDENKTTGAILAEIKKRVIGEDGIRYMLSADEVLSFLNSLEIAIEREVSKAAKEAASRAILNRDAKDAAEYAAQALNAQPDARGNIAALRAVIEDASDIIRCYDMAESDGSFANQSEEARDWFAKAAAALAAPPRNCDKGFRDIEEYRLAFRRECQSHEDCADCPISKTDAFKNGVLCFFTWLLFADEGGAK